MSKIIIILILLIILFYMLRRAAQTWIDGKPQNEATPGKDVMIQDPVCKTYVAAGTAIVEEVGDQRHYFCSQECAQHFRREKTT